MKWTCFEERTLVRRMLSGDESAFDAFFQAYYPPLFRFALARLNGNADAAEETAQSTMCKAILKLETYRGEASLFIWLRTFCRHEIFAWRAQEAKHLHSQPVEMGSISPRKALPYTKAESIDPEKTLHHQNLVRMVQSALGSLPEHYGNVLEWKYLSEYSVSEIAARLQTTEKAVESLLSRARRAFRAAVRNIGFDLAPAMKGENKS